MNDTFVETERGELETGDCEFAPTSPPHADFLAAWCPKDGSFARLPGADDFACVEAGRNVRVYANAPAVADVKPGDTFLAGIVKADHRIELGPKVLAGNGLADRRPVGQCALIDFRRDGVGVRSDCFGMCPLFYFESGDLSLVSNRFHLICLALRAAGRLELNVNAWRAMFYTNDAFSYQLTTLETPARGVRMSLHSMSFGLSDDGGLDVENAQTSQPTNVLTPDEYRSLVRRAAEEIASNLDAALRTFGDRDIVVHLTGGRDSRVNLAALLSLGKLQDVTFGTADRGRDVEIAGMLVRHFGGSYDLPGAREPSETVAAPFASLMDQRRSRFFGLYHHVDMRTNTRRLVGRKRVTVVGGCGELYRSFYQKKKVFSQLDLTRTGSEEEIRDLVGSCGHWRNVFDNHGYRGAEEQITDGFLSLSSGTVDQLLNEHYRQIRARAHFGIAKMSFTETNFGWMPLMSPSLFEAAKGLPFEERHAGRAIFDVTKELCEELAYLPYESPRPDFARSPYHVPSAFDDREPALNAGRAVENRPRGSAKNKATANKGSPSTREMKLDYMSRNAVHALNELSEIRSILSSSEQENFLKRVAYVKSANPQSIQYLYSKLSGMRDIARLSC